MCKERVTLTMPLDPLIRYGMPADRLASSKTCSQQAIALVSIPDGDDTIATFKQRVQEFTRHMQHQTICLLPLPTIACGIFAASVE